MWFETHECLETALVRERQIKKWKRDWKINLIERENPHWADLYHPCRRSAAGDMDPCLGTDPTKWSTVAAKR
jgi:hypothetical protein